DPGKGIVGTAADRIDRAQIDLVLAAPEVGDAIGPADFGEEEAVRSVPARHHVIIGTAVDEVVAVAAGNSVVAGTAPQRVNVIAAVQRVAAVAAVQQVGAVATG